jgi:hypothetical protein
MGQVKLAPGDVKSTPLRSTLHPHAALLKISVKQVEIPGQ